MTRYENTGQCSELFVRHSSTVVIICDISFQLGRYFFGTGFVSTKGNEVICST